MASWENLAAPVELGDSSLENILLPQKVMKMKPLLEWAVQPWRGSPVEPLEHLQVVLQQFLLQAPN
jgi:hypothetical protein